MSFGFDSLKSEPKGFADNSCGSPYGVQSAFVSGLSGVRKQMGCPHPLEKSQLNFHKNQEKMEMLVLRNTQGIHAPMRLAMEIKAAEKIGRLPFLPSSNLMKDIILGREDDIGFEDILNTAEFREQMGQPHAVVEKSLGIL
ncbi:hypothetical protein TKK_0016211 [Trichogramma kaykai]